jgi:hypothetical protein
VDLGVGMVAVVEEGGRRGVGSWVLLGAVLERGEGVLGSIVGEGGRRTRLTCSSSASVSVTIVELIAEDDVGKNKLSVETLKTVG